MEKPSDQMTIEKNISGQKTLLSLALYQNMTNKNIFFSF
jgi:hypothetical protein